MSNAGLTAIGVRGKDSVCFVTQKKVPDKLIDPSSVTSCFALTKYIGLLCTGRPADVRVIVSKAREKAASFRYKWGYEIPVEFLAKMYAHNTSHITQRRPYVLYTYTDTHACMRDDEKRYIPVNLV